MFGLEAAASWNQRVAIGAAHALGEGGGRHRNPTRRRNTMKIRTKVKAGDVIWGG
jgi:hypothetical protein